MQNDQFQKLVEKVQEEIIKESSKPFKIAIVGQTGVGKSTLINTLFGTNLKTDPIQPCTKEIEKVVTASPSGHEMWFYDLPGIGESGAADKKYLEMYRQVLFDVDILLWAIHSDSRSVAFDQQALSLLLKEYDRDSRSAMISKITFILTKCDLLFPPPWIFALDDDSGSGIFVPGKTTLNLLQQKADYFQRALLSPYADILVSSTFNDGSCFIEEPGFQCTQYSVTFAGLIDSSTYARLLAKYPQYTAVLNRLRDNYRVISCSSVFKFNLYQLLLVVLNKLGESAISRFEDFFRENQLSSLSLTVASEYCNIVIFDRKRKEFVYNLPKIIKEKRYAI